MRSNMMSNILVSIVIIHAWTAHQVTTALPVVATSTTDNSQETRRAHVCLGSTRSGIVRSVRPAKISFLDASIASTTPPISQQMQLQELSSWAVSSAPRISSSVAMSVSIFSHVQEPLSSTTKPTLVMSAPSMGALIVYR